MGFTTGSQPQRIRFLLPLGSVTKKTLKKPFKLSINQLVKVKSFVFRSIKETDAPHIIQLSKEAKSGLSNLPKTLDKAKQLINISQLSYSKQTTKKDQKFIFVVETNEKEIVGISGIKSHVGVERPYYSFHLNKTENHPYLELTQQPLGPTEIGSLFLSPRYRNQNIGRLLSLSRFLFIRCFKKQFTNVIIAELRGFLYKNNTSHLECHMEKNLFLYPLIKRIFDQ